TCTVTAGLMAAPAVVLVGCCRKARWSAVAAPVVTEKEVEVAPARPEEAALMEEEPVGLRGRGLDGETPATATTGVVRRPGQAPGALALTVTGGVLVVRLLKASRTCTVTAGLMAAPAVVLVGCCPKARWSAAAAVTVKVFEVAPVRPEEAALME